jgi:hypothetical protein
MPTATASPTPTPSQGPAPAESSAPAAAPSPAARVAFRKAGERAVVVKGRKLPRKLLVEVRFGALAVVLKA